MGSLEGISQSLPPGLAAHWDSLKEEEDPYIFQSELLTLAGQAWAKNLPQVSVQIYNHLKNESEFPQLVKRAGKELDGLLGKGPLGLRLEYRTPEFLRQLKDPTLYAAMFLGQGAFRVTRFRLGGWVANRSWAPALGNFGVKTVANSGALTAEALAFPLGLRGIRRLWNPMEMAHHQAFSQEFLSALLLLGSLRLSHWGAASIHRWVHGVPTLKPTAQLERSLFTNMGTLAGLNLSQYVGEKVGLHPGVDGGQALLQSLSTLLHFRAAGSLLQPLANRYLPLRGGEAYDWKISKTLPVKSLASQPLLMSTSSWGKSGKSLAHQAPVSTPSRKSGVYPKFNWKIPRSLEYTNDAGEVRKFNYDILLQPLDRFEEVGFDSLIAMRNGREIRAKVHHVETTSIGHDYFPPGLRQINLSLSEGEGQRGRAILFLENDRINVFLIHTQDMPHAGVGGIFTDWIATQAALRAVDFRLFKVINPKIFTLLKRYEILDPQRAFIESCFEDYTGWESGRTGLFYDPNFFSQIQNAHFHNIWGKPNSKLLPPELQIK